MTPSLTAAADVVTIWTNSAADAWAEWIVAVSLQLVTLAVVVAAADVLLRRAGPAVRSALWWALIARLVLPPALALPVGLVGAWPSVRAAAVQGAVVSELPVAAAIDSRLAFAVWLIGVVTLACIARWRYQRVRRQCLDASAPAPDDVVDIAHRAAKRLGLRTLPPIRVAQAQPLVLGFITPIVVLPASILERSRLEQEHVLLHELAHVRRCDPAATLVCLSAQIVFWFHPAVWCARRRLATLREMACDRTVARVLGDGTSAYRRTLILLARSAATAPAAGTIGLFQRRSALVTRLELLAKPVTMRRGTECLAAVVVALGVFVACMPRKAPSPPASAAARELSEIPPLDQLPGSLQKRYAVMRAIALTSTSEPR